MAAARKKNAASVAADPRHGSTNTRRGMEMNKHVNTTAAAGSAMASADDAYSQERRSYGDALTVIGKARSVNELMFMAAESIPDFETKNAIATGADIINDLLVEARFIIDANLRRARA